MTVPAPPTASHSERPAPPPPHKRLQLLRRHQPLGAQQAPARSLATCVRAGSVTINDLIVPPTDPRLPFGGEGLSGFGVTQGVEGLLEMTVVKVISVRSGRFRPHYDLVSPADTTMMLDYIAAAHGEKTRWPAMRLLVRSLIGRGWR